MQNTLSLMIPRLSLLLFLLIGIGAPAQPPPSPHQNFVRVERPRIPVSSEKELTLLSEEDKATTYSYFDGLGRKVMTTAVQAGPNHEDVVQPYYYHPVTGRPERTYLGYAKTYAKPGQFVDAVAEAQDFYEKTHPADVTGDSKPYALTKYDARGRVKSVTMPGNRWHANERKTTFDYFYHKVGASNPDGDYPVAHWKIVAGKPQHDRNYIARELFVTLVTDPEGRKVRTVKDQRGLIITTQSFDSTDHKWYGSYNVYDVLGRLCFVIPPSLTVGIEAEATLPPFTDAQIEGLLFQYRYDAKSRVIEEKAPGAGWTYYVYDQWERLVMTRYEGQQWQGAAAWTFYKYDALNRQIMSGQVQTDDRRAAVQEKVKGKARFEIPLPTHPGSYSVHRSFPRFPDDYRTKDYEVLTIDYYDQYAFIADADWREDLPASAFERSLPPGFSGVPLSNALNLPTGSKVRRLGATGANQWLNTVIYYDKKRHVQQAITEHHLGGTDRLTHQFSWAGERQKTLLQHTSASDSVEVLNEYEYAHNGQLLKTYQTIDEGTRVLVAQYHYNALGELTEKELHSTDEGASFLQAVNYRYNIQGALTGINDPSSLGSDVFGMDLHYETTAPIPGLDKAQRYDGLVNAMTWNATHTTPAVTPDTEGPDGSKQYGLGFNYDGRNRLQSTRYAEEAADGEMDARQGHFNMTATYDANGNIEALTRKADNEAIDILDYHYEATSNQLIKVEDAGTPAGFNNYNDGQAVNNSIEYDYDPHTGNMTFDAHKELSITYNHLQLVDRVTFEDVAHKKVLATIAYRYDALGNRLSKTVLDADDNAIATVDYVGSVEYLNGEINQLFTDEGRAYRQNEEYHYEYFLTDHQATNRVGFGEVPERRVYTATMEAARSAYEESEFAFPSNNPPVSAENHTPLGAQSLALRGTQTSTQIGPMKVLEIQPADVVELEVYARYDGRFSDGAGSVASAFMAAFEQAGRGTGAEGASASVEAMLAQPVLFQHGDNHSTEPEAYLQYLFFDLSFTFQEQGSGFVPVTEAAKGRFHKLSSGRLTFEEPGYLLVYVANESQKTDKEVFFDDLRIMHASSESAFRVTQINDYYPFGMRTANSWKAPGYIDPGLLYQSSFATLDSLTGFYNFLSRSYDPATGRFFQVDPAGQFSSPYAGMGNVPHQFVDPTGEWGWLVGAAINLGAQFLWNTAANAGQAGINSLNGNGSFAQNFNAQGFSTGVNYNTGSGYALNANNGYGGFTNPQGGTSPIWSGLPAESERFYHKIWVDPDDAEWIPSDGEDNIGGIMASRSYYFIIEGDGLLGSGVSEDSYLRYLPLVSSFIGVADAAYIGDYGGAALNIGIGASEVLGGAALKAGGKILGRTAARWGKTFSQFKAANGGGGLIGNITLKTPHKFYGTKFPVRVEYSHRWITQAAQRKYNLPNWMINNRLNVIKTNTLRHAGHDPFRYRFLPREIKLRLGPGGDLNYNMFGR